MSKIYTLNDMIAERDTETGEIYLDYAIRTEMSVQEVWERYTQEAPASDIDGGEEPENADAPRFGPDAVKLGEAYNLNHMLLHKSPQGQTFLEYAINSKMDFRAVWRGYTLGSGLPEDGESFVAQRSATRQPLP